MIRIKKYNEYIIEGRISNTFSSLYDRYKQILNQSKMVKIFNQIIKKLTEEDLMNLHEQCKLSNIKVTDLEKALNLVKEEKTNENNEKDEIFNAIAPRFAIFVGSLGALGYANEQLYKYLVEHQIAHPGLLTNGGELLLLGIIIYILYKSMKWFKK